MPTLVPNVLTRSTYSDVCEALSRAIADILEEVPTKSCLNVLAAQSAFETWEWRLMHDWNAWNLRGTFQGTATTFKAGELDEHGREVVLQPGPHNLFRAYPSLAYGVRDFVRFIFTQSRPDRPNRYAAAADCARLGDVVGYVENLRGPNRDGSWTINGERLGGFFTAVPHVYLTGTERLFRQGLEGEIDDLKAEVIKLWAQIRRIVRRIDGIEDEAEERTSETNLSLRPTGLRATLKNWRPSSFVLVALIAGVVVIVWLVRR